MNFIGFPLDIIGEILSRSVEKGITGDFNLIKTFSRLSSVSKPFNTHFSSPEAWHRIRLILCPFLADSLYPMADVHPCQILKNRFKEIIIPNNKKDVNYCNKFWDNNSGWVVIRIHIYAHTISVSRENNEPIIMKLNKSWSNTLIYSVEDYSSDGYLALLVGTDRVAIFSWKEQKLIQQINKENIRQVGFQNNTLFIRSGNSSCEHIYIYCLENLSKVYKTHSLPVSITKAYPGIKYIFYQYSDTLCISPQKEIKLSKGSQWAVDGDQLVIAWLTFVDNKNRQLHIRKLWHDEDITFNFEMINVEGIQTIHCNHAHILIIFSDFTSVLLSIECQILSRFDFRLNMDHSPRDISQPLIPKLITTTEAVYVFYKIILKGKNYNQIYRIPFKW